MSKSATTERAKSSRRSGDSRPQVAAIPFLRQAGRMLVVLVTSRETGRWVLPKGWTEPDLHDADAAAKEAFEEAGLIGHVEREKHGRYHYVKRLDRSRKVVCEVDIYLLHVSEMLEDWPERAERERRLFTPAEAAALVQEAELADLLRALG